MTTSQPDRLDRIEALVESNARSIQSLTDDLTTFRLAVEQDREEAQAERQELREATIRIATLSEGIAAWLGRVDDNQPTILRKLNSIERKVDEVLEGDNDSAK